MTSEPPPYPYDRLAGAGRSGARSTTGGMVDCPIGIAHERAAAYRVIEALASCSGTRAGLSRPQRAAPAATRGRGGPAGSTRRFDLPVEEVPPAGCCRLRRDQASCVASVPHVLRLRQPERDDQASTSAVSYPSCASHEPPAPVQRRNAGGGGGGGGGGDANSEADAAALVLWSNSPSNPTRGLGDLGAEARRPGARRAGQLRRAPRRVHKGLPACAPFLQHCAGVRGRRPLLRSDPNLAGCAPASSLAIPTCVEFPRAVRRANMPA